MLAVIFFMIISLTSVRCNDVLGCGGYIKNSTAIQYSRVEIKLFTKQGTLKYQSDCAPNNGYYFVPVEDYGDYVLKVVPPLGWIFEPQQVDLHIDGSTDLCSQNKDINFNFSGFSVIGKVVSRGLEDGPEGVRLSLLDGRGSKLAEAVTQLGGGYIFPHIASGKYQVVVNEPHLLFDQERVMVEVGSDNGDGRGVLVVSGYDLKGSVNSEGEPVKGASFLLFSKYEKPSTFPHCDRTVPTGFVVERPDTFLCHSLSNDDGIFEMKTLPPGSYQLMSFYKGDNIKFDVHPVQVDVEIKHESVELTEKFQVAGFSVSGRVVARENGSGVEGAEVVVNGQIVAITNSKGFYHLDRMKTGTYRITARAERIRFKQETVKVSPNSAQLRHIVASEFEVCGQILSENKRELPTVSWSTIEETEKWDLHARADGEFCVFLSPGKYVFRVPTSDQLKAEGVSFAPIEHIVEVKEEPISGITFSQFRAIISGSVSCLVDCNDVQVTLKHKTRKAQAVTVTDGKFSFSDILPGLYQLSVVRETWCWNNPNIDITVNLQHITNVNFEHSGFLLTLVTSHDTAIKYKLVDGSESGQFDATRGTSQVCLPQPGVYDLSPHSCHDFGVLSSRWDSHKPSPLSLTAHKHLVKGKIRSVERVSDLSIKISVEASERETVIGPVVPVYSDEDKLWYYKFQSWSRAGELVTVTPSAQDLLFTPSFQKFTVINDCMNDAVKMYGRKGLFIKGKISPPLQDVVINITAVGETSGVNLTTDADGSYSAGPLTPEITYNITAEKKGFVFTPTDVLGNFEAYKLAQVVMTTVDERGELLPGVLVTIAGGIGYRQNSLTGSDGVITFSGITPGEYFVRPIMKEYRFIPPSQMINIVEGQTVDISARGERIAWSAVGKVTSLSGKPEKGIAVESVGKDSCSEYQEEAVTDELGMFRIRGLKPQCYYDIQLKKPHLESSLPEYLTVQVNNSDAVGLHLYAFHPSLIMDITGFVDVAPEFLRTLRAKLFREQVPHAPLYVQKLEHSPLFLLPALQRDNKSYVLRLESMLCETQFNYKNPEVSFQSNESYRHFKFTFAPDLSPVDHEFGQESYWGLPFILVLLLIALNYESVFPLFIRARDWYQNGIQQAKPMLEPVLKKKVKPRKL